MIVVAIIALLAAFAVPGFIRARKRSQATVVFNDARVLESAKNSLAIENGLSGQTEVDASAIALYLKEGSRLKASAELGEALDVIGNPYKITTVDQPIKISPATVDNFSDVIDNPSDYWGEFYSPQN